MSVTTTDTTISPQVLLRTLGDYELHHSGLPAPPPNERNDARGGEALSNVENPPDWIVDERRVPPYRPINYEINLAERPGGANLVERMFIAILLNGTALNAVRQLVLNIESVLSELKIKC